MRSNTLFYHSVTKDADFENHRKRFKLTHSDSFIENNGRPHIVEKKPIGSGSYGTVRKVPSLQMVIKEILLDSPLKKFLAKKEGEISEELFDYCLFQETAEGSLVRMGMPFRQGVPLREFIKQSLTFHQLCSTVILAAEALKGLKSKGSNIEIVHEDLNLGNLLVESETDNKTPIAVHIIDMGFARKQRELTSGIWNKDAYLAPEVELMTKAKSSQDIYSFGALLWPINYPGCTLFHDKGLPTFVTNNIQFIKNQMTYFNPASRVTLDQVISFFHWLRLLEPLLIALNAKEDKQVQDIFKYNEIPVDIVVPFIARANFDEETLSLFKKYAGDADCDAKVANVKEEITNLNRDYISQWLFYYAKQKDIKALKHFCAQFDKDIIRYVLENFKVNGRALIKDILILSVECFMYLTSFSPYLSPNTVLKAFFKVQAVQESKQTSSQPLQELKNYLKTHPTTKTIRACIRSGLTLSDDLKSHMHFLNEKGQTLAHMAADSSNLPVLRQLVALSSDILWTEDFIGRTPLHIAAIKGDISILEAFHTHGAMNFLDDNQETLAHLAARHGKVDALKYLLSVNPHYLTALNREGETLAHLAIRQGHCDILQLLLSVNKDILTQPDYKGVTPLHTAALNGKIDIIDFLIKQKINLFGYERVYGCTVMHLAAGSGQVEIMKLLKTAAPSFVNVDSLRGTKPIEYAIEYGRTEAFKFLLSDFPDKDSLIHDVIKNGKVEMLALLKEQKADLNSSKIKGYTPLQMAVRLDKYHMVQALLEQKVDPNFSHHPVSALEEAVIKSNFKVINLLLEAGADADVYLKSTAATAEIAFIVLKKLKMYLSTLPDDDKTIPLKISNQLKSLDFTVSSVDWVKYLNEIVSVQPVASTSPSLFALQQPQKSSSFNFSSVKELKDFLIKQTQSASVKQKIT